MKIGPAKELKITRKIQNNKGAFGLLAQINCFKRFLTSGSINKLQKALENRKNLVMVETIINEGLKKILDMKIPSDEAFKCADKFGLCFAVIETGALLILKKEMKYLREIFYAEEMLNIEALGKKHKNVNEFLKAGAVVDEILAFKTLPISGFCWSNPSSPVITTEKAELYLNIATPKELGNMQWPLNIYYRIGSWKESIVRNFQFGRQSLEQFMVSQIRIPSRITVVEAYIPFPTPSPDAKPGQIFDSFGYLILKSLANKESIYFLQNNGEIKTDPLIFEPNVEAAILGEPYDKDTENLIDFMPIARSSNVILDKGKMLLVGMPIHVFEGLNFEFDLFRDPIIFNIFPIGVNKTTKPEDFYNVVRGLFFAMSSSPNINRPI